MEFKNVVLHGTVGNMPSTRDPLYNFESCCPCMLAELIP